MSTSPEHGASADPPSEALWDEGLRAAFGADEEQAGSSVLQGLRSSMEGGEGGGGASSVHLPALPDAADPVLDTHGEHAPGSRLGRYQVVGEIAAGGVGIVLQGRDTDLGRDVAMKVLRGRYKENRELIRRFVEEAQIGGQLQHPGVVPVYELAVDAHGRPFIAMKLVRGRTLASLLDERRSPADESARFLGIFEKVAQTVAYAHARGVVHRDLKPSNVMVGTFGEVQLMDWGFAKVLKRGGAADDAGQTVLSEQDDPIATVRSQASHRHSLHGSVLGTPAYMPPEQARGEVATLDERCDVFALGAILCEVLTGAPAYTGKQTEETLNRARVGDLDDAYARLDGCNAGPEVVALAKACLAREPRERPRNAGVVAEEITRYLGALEERARSAQVAAAESRVRLVAERQSRRLTLALVSSVLALISIAVGAGWWVDRSEVRREERADGAVQAALQEAVEHAGEGDWGSALAATERAAAMDAASPASLPVEQRITELRARFEREAKGAVLAARLREIRSSLEDDATVVDEEYSEAFRDFGIDVAALEPDAIGVRIRAEAPELSLAMALALDDWSARNRPRRWPRGGGRRGAPDRSRASEQTPEGEAETPSTERVLVDWEHLRDAAIAGDPDPWRVELRRATSSVDDEPARLIALADSADLATLDPTRFVLLGRALRMADKRERAIEVLQAGFARHPDDYWINVQLAWLYSLTEEPDLARAREHARIAVSLRPDSSSARGMLAMILRSSGEREEAMHVVFESIRANPTDGRARRELDWFMFDVEDAAQDERTVRAILARDPTSSGALDLLARLLDLRCDWPAALDAWTRLIATLPAETAGSFGQGYAQRSLGKALEELGRYEEAAAAYRRVAVPGRRERDFFQNVVQHCERLNAIAPRALSDAPETFEHDELLLAARVCQHAGYFARATALYARYFASDPEAGPTSFVGQYDAVACAVQAGVGHGPDAPPLASPEAAQSRAQALAWMRANLADHPRTPPTPPEDRTPPSDGPDPGRRPRDGDPPRGGGHSSWRLARWRHDVRLDPVRNPARLAELPPEEAAEWAGVWTELVAELERRRTPPRR